MSAPVPNPPVPAPPRQPGGSDLPEAVDRLEGIDPQNLEGVLAAAEDVHTRLRERLGQAGAR